MNSPHRFGVIASYVHAGAGLGALVELCCESRAAALSRELRELAHDLALHVAAANPLVVCIEDLTPAMIAAASGDLHARASGAGRAGAVVQRMVEAHMRVFHDKACLLEQKFIKDSARTIHEVLDARGALLKERLRVVRFARFCTADQDAAAGESA